MSVQSTEEHGDYKLFGKTDVELHFPRWSGHNREEVIEAYNICKQIILWAQIICASTDKTIKFVPEHK